MKSKRYRYSGGHVLAIALIAAFAGFVLSQVSSLLYEQADRLDKLQIQIEMMRESQQEGHPLGHQDNGMVTRASLWKTQTILDNQDDFVDPDEAAAEDIGLCIEGLITVGMVAYVISRKK